MFKKILIGLVIAIPIILISGRTGYNIGYKKGGVFGCHIALDTVSKIMNHHSKHKLNTGRVILQGRDTTSYYISAKILENE